MSVDKEIARIAKLRSDSTRANILSALMARKALTAGGLAL